MASPKNYERQKNQENQRTPYVWQHQGLGPELKVRKSSGFKKPDKWKVLISGFPPHYGSTVVAMDSNKQDARKKAVRWMEDHPRGGRFRTD